MYRDWQSCPCSASPFLSMTNWTYIQIQAADCRKHGWSDYTKIQSVLQEPAECPVQNNNSEHRNKSNKQSI